MTSLMRNIYALISTTILLLISGCSEDKKGAHIQTGGDVPIQAITEIKYAKRFNITYFNSYKKISVNEPWPGSPDTLVYIIIGDESIIEAQKENDAIELIQQPIEKIVCFSTTHLPYLEMIEEESRLTGFPTIDYIYSEKFLDMAKAGRIKDLGPSNDINFESLLELNPDLVFAFSMGNELSMIRKIQLSGIPVVLNADYLEDHPLGRAEWIKFIAAFFNKDQEADSIFNEIEKSYLKTKVRMDNIDKRPGIFTGVVYGDTWFMPGGQHYGTRFFNDAGGKYIWSDNESENILQLSFESVYEKAAYADFWIGTATYNSLEEIEHADSRYTDFKAFKTGNIYNYSARVNDKGGNAYFELGYARPDIILKDLAKIFHPDEMNDHQFYFYKKLY
jgi:iron complex transport system substrate-binding protein